MPSATEKLKSRISGEPAGNVGSHIPTRLALFLFLLTLTLFANTINHYYLLDDFEVLYSVKYNKLSHVLLGYDTVMENKFLRPIPMFFFWLQFKLFGLTPVIFHITTLLLHASCAILAANLFCLLFGNFRAAAIMGLIFVAFPNHSEVINWPSINFTLWDALFYLATLNLFACYRLSSRKSFFLMSVLTFLAALFSKESAFTLPVSIVLLDFFISRSGGVALPVSKRLRDHALYFGMLFGVLLLTRALFSTGAGYPTVEGENLVSLYLGNIYALVIDVIRMNLVAWKYLFAPIGPEVQFAKALTFEVLFLVAISIVFLIWKRRINLWFLAYSFLFVSITWLPVLGTFKVLPITQWIRFLYLPSAASCYIIAIALDGILTKIKEGGVKYAILALAIIPMVVLTKFYDNEWVKAEDANSKTMGALVKEIRELPPYSRVYVSGTPWANGDIPRIAYAMPAAVALYCSRDYVEGGLAFLPANKILALDRERDIARDWQYFRLDWDEKAGKVTATARIQLEGGGEPRSCTWDFGKSVNQQALQIARDIVPARRYGISHPTFAVDGPWSLLWLPRLDGQRPIRYLTLEMMIKGRLSKKDVSRVFWIAEDDTEITGGKSIGFFSKADGEFHEYKIPLYRNGLSVTDPRILGFAIRPSQERGTIFSIKKMSVEYY